MIHNNYFSRIATPAKFSATKFSLIRGQDFFACYSTPRESALPAPCEARGGELSGQTNGHKQ